MVFLNLILDNAKTPKIDTFFSRIFALGMHTSNPLASNNTRTKGFFNLILDYEKLPKIYTFFGDFCARHAHKQSSGSRYLSDKVFFSNLILNNVESPKIVTFLPRIFRLGKTSNSSALDNTRIKVFF